ncbi:hypothetical protein [Vibrio penaeicida]|uniref:hypothetical protein n=1 Tax=Vibrio penaeicida TaxID=104609 RepID=UPI001CC4A3D9|nr:hypothetical protein [Vibrio penaeicida]
MNTKVMNKIQPDTLSGARIYFTGFDKKSYLSRDKDEIYNILKRSLKVLLLTKNKIVFGAAHLKGQMAFDLVLESPELFSSGILIPALNNKHDGDLSGALGKSYPWAKQRFYNDLFQECVEWDFYSNTTWFREKLLQGFAFSNSLLRKQLKHTSSLNISIIIDIIGNFELGHRKYLQAVELHIHKKDFPQYKRYKNLIYNTSGARVVNCESALDQENMTFDYSLDDIKKNETFLSNEQVFNRLFIEQVFSTLDRVSPSMNMIDSLSFKDILELRTVIDNSNFIEKYNNLVELSSKIIMQKDHIDFYSLNELANMADDIHSRFKVELEKEVSHFINKENGLRQKNVFIESSYGVIKSLSSLCNPIASTVTSSMDLCANSIYLIKNLYNVIESKGDIKARSTQSAHKNKALEMLLEKSSIDSRTAMFDTIKMLNNYILEKQRI